MNIRKILPSPMTLLTAIIGIFVVAVMGMWQNPFAPEWINQSYLLRGLLSAVIVFAATFVLILVVSLLDLYDKWWHNDRSKN